MGELTRFAPSPTGYLHLGHAYAAWQVWRRGAPVVLRLEDIDRVRCRPEFVAGIFEDLAWLGFAWVGEVRVQSAHLNEYAAALGRLAARGVVYPCFCSRSEIARAQGAPHGGEAAYPGTCRGLSEAARAERIAAGAAYAMRLDVLMAAAQVGEREFFDEGVGWVKVRPAVLGDVVLARKDVPTSYHLCVVHDDAAQGVDLVVRGEDLRPATHVHVLLQALLGFPVPAYAHHRLLTDASGRRLAKRDGAVSLRALREAGERPEVWFERWRSEAA
jgi:glutamyl-Q tRNA(Asp) synthetase